MKKSFLSIRKPDPFVPNFKRTFEPVTEVLYEIFRSQAANVLSADKKVPIKSPMQFGIGVEGKELLEKE